MKTTSNAQEPSSTIDDIGSAGPRPEASHSMWRVVPAQWARRRTMLQMCDDSAGGLTG